MFYIFQMQIKVIIFDNIDISDISQLSNLLNCFGSTTEYTTIYVKNMNLIDKKMDKFLSFILNFKFFQLILEDNIGMKDFCLDKKN